MDVVVGGFSKPKKATEETQNLCDEVKNEAESRTGKNFHVFRAVEYQNQVVAGMNYRIKVNVGGGQHITLEIFQALPCYGGKVELTGVDQ